MSDQGISVDAVQKQPIEKAWENYEKRCNSKEVLDSTELYRHFDEYGRLLYVGVSLRSLQRLLQHREKCEWFDLIHSITIERWPTRELALIAEKQAIRNEHPYFNKRGSLMKRKWEPLTRKRSAKAPATNPTP
jgi:hypothetical protein